MTDDTRVTCKACRAYQAGHCINGLAAGMPRKRFEIGSTLAALKQNCPAHQPLKPQQGR